MPTPMPRARATARARVREKPIPAVTGVKKTVESPLTAV